jgi:hypothetical protein
LSRRSLHAIRRAIRGGYCGERLCLSFAHLSHGAQLGIQGDAANFGLNFLFLEYRLPE